MISIADAKNRLPALIHQAEAGQPVTITRRGKPVAVVVSVEDYEHLRAAPALRKSGWEVLQEIRAELGAADVFPDWTDEEIDSWRDRRPSEPRCDFEAADSTPRGETGPRRERPRAAGVRRG